MERTEFLNLCQKCAKLKEFGQIKQDVPDELKVKANGCAYYPVGYELAFDESGAPVHKAILHDLKARCVVYFPLDKVVNYNG